MTDSVIKGLIDYAVSVSLIAEEDRIFCTNAILALLKKQSFDPQAPSHSGSLPQLLEKLCDYAAVKGRIDDSVTCRDLFDTALMGALMPRPSQVISRFNELYAENPERATDYFYKLAGDSNYIRRDRIAKMLAWKYENEYGTLDITINLSKPEKDPKEIAAAKNAVQTGYPKCMLCVENEGYAGRLNFPARQNLRVIPVTLGGEQFYMQYSPYVYYNEHCIVFSSQHKPMAINRDTFVKLLDFVKLFPHYFIGSNADLPIVGGSILSHEHFQGGHFEFAMERAPIEKNVLFSGFSDVKTGIVKWPMSTLRLRSEKPERLIMLADKILTAWRSYTDESAFIFAQTNGESHNTITPIARRRGSAFELDLVLRNNITTEQQPLGVFHPHKELHHIKKENIGLIEVMGLAVLPARLKAELEAVAQAIFAGEDLSANPLTAPHAEWASEIAGRYTAAHGDIHAVIRKEVGAVFSMVLEHAGVFKRSTDGSEAFMRFIQSVQ